MNSWTERVVCLLEVAIGNSLPKSFASSSSASSFAKGVLLLAGGTMFSQTVVILAMPIISRLYSPHDLGIQATFVALLTFPVVIVAWRYEVAVVLPEEDITAVNLLVLALSVAAGMSVMSGAVLYIAGGPLCEWLGVASISNYLWLFPLGLAGAGSFQILNYWAIRDENFKLMARAKLNQSLGLVFAQILMGVTRFGPIGLLFGEIIGRSSGAGLLWGSLWKNQRQHFVAVSLSEMWSAAKRYWRFPVLSAGATLLNEAGTAVPTLLLGSLYGMETLGWFALAQKFIGWPSMLLGQAVGQVYLGEASRLMRCDPSAAIKLFSSTLKRVFLVAVGPMIALAVAAPTLFVFIFGPSWEGAGQFARSLSMCFLARAVVVPVATTLNIVERQDLQLYWDVGRLVLVVTVIYYASASGWTANAAVILYAIVNAVAYIMNAVICAKALHQKTSIIG